MLRCLAFLLAQVVQLPAQVDAKPPALLEGPVTGVYAVGGAAHLTMLGQIVVVGRATVVATPTARLSMSQILDATPFPGRTQPGLVGCTAIVRGTIDPATGFLVAADAFFEPAENVIIGQVTANVGGQVRLNGALITPCADPRLPALPVRNAFGFEVVLASVLPPVSIAAEGWFDGMRFHAHTIEVDGPATLTLAAPQVSIQRATVSEHTPNTQQGDEVDVRGAVTMAHAAPNVTTQALQAFRIDGSTATWLGSTTATRDEMQPGFAIYRLRLVTAPSAHPVLGRAPGRVRIVNVSPGANGCAVEAATTGS